LVFANARRYHRRPGRSDIFWPKLSWIKAIVKSWCKLTEKTDNFEQLLVGCVAPHPHQQLWVSVLVGWNGVQAGISCSWQRQSSFSGDFGRSGETHFEITAFSRFGPPNSLEVTCENGAAIHEHIKHIDRPSSHFSTLKGDVGWTSWLPNLH
jgi:hypothetical protein